MDSNQDIIRGLSHIEEALTISNDAYPLCVVCVLHLANGPEINVIEAGLAQLQGRHPLLQASISKIKGRFYFKKLNPIQKLELIVVEREEATTFQTIAEQALNTTFAKTGPLMKCWYLPNPEKGLCKLIVCFHHAIIDGTSARLLLHELLSLLGKVALPEAPPMVSPKFPSALRGHRLLKWILTFGGRQLKEEWNYKRKGLTSPIPVESRNATLSFKLSSATSRRLSVRAGRAGLSMNSILLAAITLALCRHRHEIQGTRRVRAISFADLRSSLVPPLSRYELGCYISMMRLDVPFTLDQSVWQLAEHIRSAIFKASRRGEVLLMAIMSKYLFKMALLLRNTRLGVSGLSFIGTLDLKPQYGTICLQHVEAFITNNCFGPEFSAFGKVLFGCISLDFTYLPSEMGPGQARQIMENIKEILENIANSP